MNVSRNLEPQVDALPSYRSSPEDAKLDQTKVKQMAEEASADGALIVQSVSVEEKTEVSPTYFPSAGFGILAGMFPLHGPVGTVRREFIGMRSMRLKRLLMI